MTNWVCCRVILATGASLTAGVLFMQMAVLPLMFRYSKLVQRKLVFSNCFNYPRNLDYQNPSSVDIVGGRNFTIKFDSKVDGVPVKLGVWHMIPCSMFREVFVIKDYVSIEKRLLDDLRTTSNTIIIYCHGYGDSTMLRPTEQGVVEDALSVYGWLNKTVNQENRPTIILWGHSLGTSVAANMVAHIRELCERAGKPCPPQPDMLVLEAPFNNLQEEIECHPISKCVSWLPYFKEYIVKPFCDGSEYAFTTDKYIAQVPHIPILMLHSKYDKIVPYSLAVKLHEAVKASRMEGGAPVVFHTFDKCSRLGHNNLCQAADMKQVLTNFINLVQNGKNRAMFA